MSDGGQSSANSSAPDFEKLPGGQVHFGSSVDQPVMKPPQQQQQPRFQQHFGYMGPMGGVSPEMSLAYLLKKQLTYYFSADNLSKDAYLVNQVCFFQPPLNAQHNLRLDAILLSLFESSKAS